MLHEGLEPWEAGKAIEDSSLGHLEGAWSLEYLDFRLLASTAMREQKPVVSSHHVCDLQLQQPLGGQCSLTAHPSLATHFPISAGHQQQTSHHPMPHYWALPPGQVWSFGISSSELSPNSQPPQVALALEVSLPHFREILCP